jgi:integrase
MAWAEIDLDAGIWRKPASRTKAGREQVLPLPAAAVELIRTLPVIDDSALLFPSSSGRPVTGLSGPKVRLDALSGVDAWTYHDIRRTVASGLARLGASDLVVAGVLGHSRSAILGVTSRYDRHGRAEEQRAALERWTSHVLRTAAAGGSADVVPLARRA